MYLFKDNTKESTGQQWQLSILWGFAKQSSRTCFTTSTRVAPSDPNALMLHNEQRSCTPASVASLAEELCLTWNTPSCLVSVDMEEIQTKPGGLPRRSSNLKLQIPCLIFKSQPGSMLWPKTSPSRFQSSTGSLLRKQCTSSTFSVNWSKTALQFLTRWSRNRRMYIGWLIQLFSWLQDICFARFFMFTEYKLLCIHLRKPFQNHIFQQNKHHCESFAEAFMNLGSSAPWKIFENFRQHNSEKPLMKRTGWSPFLVIMTFLLLLKNQIQQRQYSHPHPHRHPQHQRRAHLHLQEARIAKRPQQLCHMMELIPNLLLFEPWSLSTVSSESYNGFLKKLRKTLWWLGVFCWVCMRRCGTPMLLILPICSWGQECLQRLLRWLMRQLLLVRSADDTPDCLLGQRPK